jgi:type IV secretory pathway TrbD component
MIATLFPAPWERLSEIGDWVIVLFGMALWAVCLLSLFQLGVRAISAARHKLRKRRTARHAKQRS